MILNVHRTPSSAEACEQLADAGANVFELDVRLGRGGDVVVSHFLPLLRIPGWLENDGQQFRWGPSASSDDLSVVLERIPPTCEVSLDLKEDVGSRQRRFNRALVAALPDRERFYVSAKDLSDLADFRAAGFRTWRSIGGRRQLKRFLADPAGEDHAVTIRHSLLDVDVIAALRDRSPRVIAWTVNDIARARELKAMGVDGITSDSRRIFSSIRDDV